MSDDRSDLEEAVRLLRGWGGRHFAPYMEAETRDFLAQLPETRSTLEGMPLMLGTAAPRPPAGR